MKSKSLVISTGFAMFSMFFGSGNLVFPIAVGQESFGHYLWGFLGIFLTGVLVPFLGIIAMLLNKGSTTSFLNGLGRIGTFWFPLMALSLMGPFGVLARCITVAHGSFRILFPESSLVLFSLIFCFVIYLATVRQNKIVPLLGTILTPILLLSLAAIVVCGMAFGTNTAEVVPGTVYSAFKTGFFQGYQTMDLLAAFFFSTFVIKHLESNAGADLEWRTLWKVFLKSSLVGAGLLATVYLSLVFLGNVYAANLSNIAPEEFLGRIAALAMGSQAAPVVCVAVVLACFTTAMVLAVLFADFLQKEVVKDKIGKHSAMFATLIIAFVISTLEFAGIAKFLAPILEATYPALIVMTLMNIANKLWGFSNPRWPVAATLAVKVVLLPI